MAELDSKSSATPPLDADSVHRAVFAACQRAGRADPLLARELSAAVLNIAGSSGDLTPTSLEDRVVQLLREFGQPAIAERVEAADFEEPANRAAGARWLRSSLDPRLSPHQAAFQAAAVFNRRAYAEAFASAEIRSAIERGLIEVAGWETPLELPGGLVDLHRQPNVGIGEVIHWARRRFGQFVVFDSPEDFLADRSDRQIDLWLAELRDSLGEAGLTAVFNLRVAEPPTSSESWWRHPSLFQVIESDERRREESAVRLADRLLRIGAKGPWRIDWHVRESDWAVDGRLRHFSIIESAFRDLSVQFVLERPRGPVALAEGVTRDTPAVLACIMLNCDGFLECLSATDRSHGARLAGKLGTLTRLAQDVGHQRQDFLRRYGRPEAASEFLLERACLVVSPRPPKAWPMAAKMNHQAAEECIRSVLSDDLPRQAPATIDWPPPMISARDPFGDESKWSWASSNMSTVVQCGPTLIEMVDCGWRMSENWLSKLLRAAWARPDVNRLLLRPTVTES